VDVTGNNTTTEILNEYHYYPFGMNMAYDWTNNVAIDNKYQYNGKEMNDDFGLNWNDYGFRWYDAVLGRWWAVDPVDDFDRQPYGYANNNPVNNIDFMGMSTLRAEEPVRNPTAFGVGTLGSIDATRHNDLPKPKPDLEWKAYRQSDGSISKPVQVGDRGGDAIDYISVYQEAFNPNSKVEYYFTPVSHNTINMAGGGIERGYGYRNKYQLSSPAIESFCYECLFFPAPSFLIRSGMLGRFAFGGAAAKGGNYVVYEGVDIATGTVRYVGMTGRDASVRFAEHLSSRTPKAFLDYNVVPGATGLSKTQARVFEQTLINKYGLSKNSGLLLNSRNSIAPKYWWQYGIK
jgi:RHS repeat-associated protein